MGLLSMREDFGEVVRAGFLLGAVFLAAIGLVEFLGDGYGYLGCTACGPPAVGDG